MVRVNSVRNLTKNRLYTTKGKLDDDVPREDAKNVHVRGTSIKSGREIQVSNTRRNMNTKNNNFRAHMLHLASVHTHNIFVLVKKNK